MMTLPEVHIHRCDVGLVRSAADGAALIEREDHLAFAKRMQPLVLEMIEQFLAERLAREGDDIDIARLDVELTLPASVQQGALPLARAAIRERIDAAIATAMAKARAAGHLERRQQPVPDEPAAAAIVAAPASTPHRPDGILAVLAEWFEQHQLTLRLTLLGPVALARLFARARRALARVAPEAAGAEPSFAAPARGMPEPADAAEGQLRNWLARAALWAARTARGVGEKPNAAERDELLAQAERLVPFARKLAAKTSVPLPSDHAAHTRVDDHRPSALPPPADEATSHRSEQRILPTAPNAPVAQPRALRNGRYEIACALPWLALLRLAEHGALAGLPPDDPALPALAYALALKLHSPAPETGRPWGDEATAAAALTAGLADAPDGAALIEAAGMGEALFDLAGGGVNAAMRPALIELAGMPAVHARGQVVVFDPVGFYPAGTVPATVLADIVGGAHALLMFPAADAAGLHLAADAGLKAACQGLPAARERFARLDGPRGWRGMANVPAAALTGHRGMLPNLADRAEQALGIWLDLTERRPLTAPAAAGQVAPLDRCAALMAGFALADIAWRLSEHDPQGWREPDPLLTRERFGDLSARVDVSDGEVAVTLPLGVRFADLFAARLLDVTPRLPWLGERALRIGGG